MINEFQKTSIDVLIEVDQDSDFDRYWLTIGEDEVKRIKSKQHTPVVNLKMRTDLYIRKENVSGWNAWMVSMI